MNFLPVLLVLSLLTCCIEVDISIPSFPFITEYFKISVALTQMTVAVNFLGFCLSSIFYGPLSDAYGRRKIMLYGNAIMALGACGCALADNIELLLLSRFIQGIGASTSAVVAFTMVADAYTVERSAKIISIMNSLITIFTSTAPIAGGFVNELFGWRGNYTIIALISVISWILLYYFLPETQKEQSVFTIKKVYTDFKQISFDNRFIYSSLIPSLIYSGWMAFIACSSFLYIETYKMSIINYACHQGAIVSVFCIFSFICGRINNYIGMKNSIKYGIGLILTGSTMLFTVSYTTSNAPYLTSISMMIYGTGSAISYPVIFVKSLDLFPKIKGSASSLIMSTRALICALAVSLSSYFYNGYLFSIAVLIMIIAFISLFFTVRLLKIMNFDNNVKDI